MEESRGAGGLGWMGVDMLLSQRPEGLGWMGVHMLLEPASTAEA